MNKSDSERIATICKGLGYKISEKIENADLIIINTCKVRQSAENRVYGLADKISELKKANKNLKVVLTGCIVGIETGILKKDQEKLEFIDLFLNIDNIDLLATFLFPNKNFDHSDTNSYLEIKPVYKSNFQAYIPIMTGCNNFCSYCVVPYARGEERSRNSKKILEEAEELILNKKYKEITLLGQNVNSYKYEKTNFHSLLSEIDKIPGKYWLRFITSHPKDLSDALIKTVENSKHITPHFHLPVQSGDNEILKKMNRNYTIEYYKELIEKIREKIPNAAISTDIIVGFPQEAEKQFENTVKLFKEIKFDMAYIAQYSERKGTAAARLEDNISALEKKKRKTVLTEILKETALSKDKKGIGKVVEILATEWKNGFLLGKSAHYKTVKFRGSKKLVGKFTNVKITDAQFWGLKGEIMNKKTAS